MKKILIVLILLFLSTVLFAQQITIKNAIIDFVERINIGNNTVAVLNIYTLSIDWSNYLINLIETELTGTRAQPVSRQRINSILIEQNLGISGYIDDNTAARLGNILGAKYIIVGDLLKIENKYILNLQILDSTNASIILSRNYEIRNSELRQYENLVKEQERQKQREGDRIANKEKQRIASERFNTFIDSISPKIEKGNWSPFSYNSFEIGYNYAPYFPVGFTIGTFGVYTSWNFYNTDYMNYSVDSDGDTYSGDEYSMAPKTYDGLQWILGYNLNIINNFLMIPIGIGGIHCQELRLYSEYSFKSEQWHSPNDWASKLLLEVGLIIVPINHVYIQGTVRMIGLADGWSFTLGGGAIWF
jgi:hypothetical protein